jgi:hypothetical protein
MEITAVVARSVLPLRAVVSRTNWRGCLEQTPSQMLMRMQPTRGCHIQSEAMTPASAYATVPVDAAEYWAGLKASDKTKLDRLFEGEEDDGDRRGGRHRRRVADGGDYGDRSANQFGCQRRHSIELILRPAIYDRYVLAIDIAAVL